MIIDIEKIVSLGRNDTEYSLVVSAEVRSEFSGGFSLEDYEISIHKDGKQLRGWRYDVVYYHIKDKLDGYNEELIQGAENEE